MSFKNVAGVIFDFDGVIVDSFAIHKTAWENAYKKIFRIDMPQNLMNELHGLSPRNIASFLAKKAGHPHLAEEVEESKLSILLSESLYPELYYGVKDLFTYLIDKKIVFGIASNASQKFIGKCIEHYNLPVTNYFGYESFSNFKPHPEPYIICAKHLNIDPIKFKKVIVFEDSMPGIASALSAGMVAIGVETKINKENLLESGANYTCKDLSVPLIEQWF